MYNFTPFYIRLSLTLLHYIEFIDCTSGFET